ncbi:MAG: NUDIX hydrolase [Cellvibrionaceae bacterium]|nr:NUDIX hydrolase [Cellvibrionaceae bacterium]
MNDIEESDYLASYDLRCYDIPMVSVDAALFTFHEDVIKILLVQRQNHPDKGKWGLPGGFVDKHKDRHLEDTVLRKIQEKTGVVPPYIEQLQSFGSANRDKRDWSITICYSALISYQSCAPHISTVADAAWVNLKTVARRALAFDHQSLIAHARERLRQKALYSVVPGYALPEKFTFPELQKLHEALIGKPLQKRSFRRRIEAANLLEDTGEKRSEKGPPAILYRLRKNSAQFTFNRNLEE